MKTSLFVVLAAVLICLALNGGQPVVAVAAASPAAGGTGTDQLIVWLDGPGTSQAAVGDAASAQRAALELTTARLSAEAGVGLTYLHPIDAGGQVLKLEATLPADEVQALAARLAEQPGILRVEPNWRMQPLVTPNDPGWYNLWAMGPYSSSAGMVSNAGIDVEAAWQITTGDPNLVIAVIDTGLLMQHQDLHNRYVAGYDMISDLITANDGNLRDADPSDSGYSCGTGQGSDWHGSHVAGIIAAEANNAIGVTGINWQSKILPVRVLGCDGGYTTDIVDAIRWSVGLPVFGVPLNPTPASVINVSLGGKYACSWYFQEAINAATAAGAVVVAAAGNDGVDASSFSPASCDGVITVGASNIYGEKAGYSNFGNKVEISAPGGDYDRDLNISDSILSTVWDVYKNESGYAFMDGTSMAAPHVAGVLSLMYSVNPDLPPDLASVILQRTASPFSTLSGCSGSTYCGAGIINAGRAVAAAQEFLFLKSPSSFEKAFAGDATAPHPITVITNHTLKPGVVTIGGLEASLVSVTTQNGRDYLSVQPAVMLANGLYDLSVNLDGTAYTQSKAVFFGQQIYLPAIVH